jgi:lipid-binding SYLF domain-containing protein
MIWMPMQSGMNAFEIGLINNSNTTSPGASQQRARVYPNLENLTLTQTEKILAHAVGRRGSAHRLVSTNRVRSMSMNKREFLIAAAALAALSLFSSGCTTSGSSSGDPAARRAAIDADVERALSRLYDEVRGSRELVGSARAVLVFPSVVSAGFMIGGSHGVGALQKGGTTVRNFSMTAASVGLLAGARTKSVFYLFMAEDALTRFESSSGWTVGADASVTVINVGANAQVDTRSVQQPVIGFVLTNAGLMGNLSMDGTRITPLNL